MKLQILAAICAICLCPAAISAAELIYQGDWKTTTRPLDGQITCTVTPLAKHEWQGRLYGVWQGVAFDYTVNFSGPPDDLRGTATIDGAEYQWRARMSHFNLKANFTGDRYNGSFDLQRKVTPVAR